MAGPQLYEIKDSELDAFDISGIPTHFDHPNGRKIELNNETLTYDFDLIDDVKCYI